MNVLVVEDNLLHLSAIEAKLKSCSKVKGITAVSNHNDAIQRINSNLDLAFIDINLSGKDTGLELAKLAKENGVFSIILSSCDSDSVAEQAYQRCNVDDYILKPISQKTVNDVLEKFEGKVAESKVKNEIRRRYLTQDQETIDSLEVIEHIYNSKCELNLLGPTGTGKSLIAEIVHDLSRKNKNKFHSVNCATIPKNLAESILFGHVRGAFSGADTDRAGILEAADGGTLFLDEIASLSIELQQKLLTAVETKRFNRLGDSKNIVSADFRLISATSKDLAILVAEGKFLPDLLYRLNKVQIRLKPLRDRAEDIQFLTKQFMNQNSSGRKVVLRPDTLKAMEAYKWPGNIRELKNFVSSWYELDLKVIERKHIRKYIQDSPFSGSEEAGLLSKKVLAQIEKHGLAVFLRQLKKEATLYTYRNNGMKARETIRRLGITQDYLYKVLRNEI